MNKRKFQVKLKYKIYFKDYILGSKNLDIFLQDKLITIIIILSFYH